MMRFYIGPIGLIRHIGLIFFDITLLFSYNFTLWHVCPKRKMTKENNQKLKELEEKRDKFTNKIFYLMLEILVIFGAPAAAAFFVGAWLDSTLETGGKTLQLISLAIAFVLSWVITIMKYRKIDRELKELDKQIKELKN